MISTNFNTRFYVYMRIKTRNIKLSENFLKSNSDAKSSYWIAASLRQPECCFCQRKYLGHMHTYINYWLLKIWTSLLHGCCNTDTKWKTFWKTTGSTFFIKNFQMMFHLLTTLGKDIFSTIIWEVEVNVFEKCFFFPIHCL